MVSWRERERALSGQPEVHVPKVTETPLEALTGQNDVSRAAQACRAKALSSKGLRMYFTLRLVMSVNVFSR